MNYENLWPLIPAECEYYAMDEDGAINAFSAEPKTGLCLWTDSLRCQDFTPILGTKAILTNRPTNWRTSLRSRPRPDDGLKPGDWVQCRDREDEDWPIMVYRYVGYDAWSQSGPRFCVGNPHIPCTQRFAYCRKDPRKEGE